MPTARELLEQADALMRRNRAAAVAVEEIPELNDEVPSAVEIVATDARPLESRPDIVVETQPDDVPELTEAVAYVDAESIEATPVEDPEVSRWFESELGTASVTGPAPDSIALVAPPPALNPETPPLAVQPETPFAEATGDEFEPLTPTGEHALEATLEAPGAEPAPRSPAEAAFDDELEAMEAATAQANAAEDQRWAALAEEIRMQVLQRIDIFTDTGMQQQLAARLQPIVDRASADLVATINQHVGTLLRAYVAEAIEREIEKWRLGGR